MSRFLPMRVQDLPPLEPDSEDDDPLNTPLKDSLMTTSTNDIKCKLKRVAELPPLEPDSDDEDNLNCARLNESFVLSYNESGFDELINSKSINIDANENDNNNGEKINKNAINLKKDENERKEVDKRIIIFQNNKENKSPEQSPIAQSIRSPIKSKTEDSILKNMTSLSVKPSTDTAQNQINFKSTVQQPTYRPINQTKRKLPFQNESFKQELRGLSIFNSLNQRIDNLTTTFNRPVSTTSTSPTDLIQKHEKINTTVKISPPKRSDETVEKNKTLNIFQTPQIKLLNGSVKGMPYHSTAQKTGNRLGRITASGTKQRIIFSTPTVIKSLDSIKSSTASLAANLSVDLALNESFKPKKPQSNRSSEMNDSEQDSTVDMKLSTSELHSFLAGSGINKSLSICTSEKRKTIEINGRQYELGKKIGSGASSSVFLVRREDKEYALKFVNLHNDAAVVEGYLNETKLLAKLQGNDGVIRLFEYCHLPQNHVLYMLMEVGECDLQKILKSHSGNIPLYTLVNYWYQILLSVNYIHQNGVIHSDLKPANFLMVNGRLKLIDFGISSNIATESTSIIKHSQAGTFNYISPEALTDVSSGCSPINKVKIRISTKSDVWSLGCILYFLLYKKTPFTDIKNIMLKIGAITNPNTKIQYPLLPNYYPSMLLEMVQQCLQHNHRQRPSVAELLKFPFHMIIPIKFEQ